MSYNKYFIRAKSVILFFVIILFGCNKFLSEKNERSLSVPNSIMDLQAIIDNFQYLNNRKCGAGVLSSDEYYLPLSVFNWLNKEQNRHLYTWSGDDWFTISNGWTTSYDNVYKANTILEGCQDIKRNSENQKDLDNLRGQALFLRGTSFFDVAKVWALAYDPDNSKKTLGIPLRLTTDFNIPSVRSNLDETYDRIIDDLKGSISLLPNKAVHVYRASRPAACAELARVYLSMRVYDSCFKYVDMALSLFNTLIDFNDLDTTEQFPISRFGPEVVYQNQLYLQFTPYTYVDSVIIESFDEFDLRKPVFFNKNSDGSYKFVSYNGAFEVFGGIAADELYLMRAECYVRAGNIEAALKDLNYLLSKRYLANHFIPYKLNNTKDLLSLILMERKKELLFRGLRFMDIKRLNMEGFNISVKRIVDGKSYVLAPNDPRFALQIPKNVIEISGMKQNSL